MSTQGGQFTGAAEQVKANAAGRAEVGWDRALPGGAFHAARSRRTRGVALVLVLVCLLALPPLAPAETAPILSQFDAQTLPGDEYWATGFNLSGLDRPVNALAVGRDSSLYAGGYFWMAGGVSVNNVARWDGFQWQPMGSGMGSPIGDQGVFDLALGPDGSLYAAGWFSTAGSVTANNIARWDGAQWHALGSGMPGYYPTRVSALALSQDGSLYAGGSFTTAGGIAANNIARWDGAQWHPLGSGMDGSVSALALGPDGSFYAGGSFTTAGGVTANNIARWDGTQWHPLASGMDGSVGALAVGTDGSLYVGGDFASAGGVTVNKIARWDSAQWHPLGSGMGGEGYVDVRALAVGPDGSLYVGGNFTTAGGVIANNIARWDNAGWHPLGSGMGGDLPWVRTLAVGPDSLLYAGGFFTIAGGQRSSYIAQWNGEAVRRCDFNDSGVVDVDDIMIVVALWGQPAGPPYDLDGDGVITVVDITRVARWWGWSVP